MTEFRFRGAVAPLRRPAAPALPRTVDGVVAALRPEEPLHCLRPAQVAATASAFLAAFPGTTMYAVKCNPEPGMLRALWAGGVRHFDCASAAEVRLVRSMFPDAAIHFMHPVKARSAIREAHAQHGVRDFVVDSAAELAKVLAETGNAADLGIIVRLALPKGEAVMDLSGKFGAEPAVAVELLRAARPVAARLGVSFHVGSQCLEPGAYARAIALAAQVIREAGVKVEVLDVGGGFPVAYPDILPPPLSAFMAAIRDAFQAAALPGVQLWAEPGRALVAGGASVVLQVQARRGGELFVNDGVYGALSDAGVPGFRFPVRLLRASGAASVPFAFQGPTCDSADRMAGPFLLPADVQEGDWIEVGQLGAYGGCLRTAFNGFDRAGMVDVIDPPLLDTPGYFMPAVAA
ncbi:type III PLP-dependent enzyme [Roseomonas stagni]|uniref:ornithine decarboxylase n=1 Tax=Falsiroseomonas algicola TaxID=2716930 RepID=A0A6M1LEL0_9PROT|nr:type III PLP-dependent enzyme [Falsiroseomonas algicola]NGM18641.1 type III PLP-dependent enzyme [Falsiroseomonas algicola]